MQTASWPRASAAASRTAARTRAATSAYGSPHEGRNGFRRYSQCCGWRSAPSPTPNRRPSKWFAASMSRSSVTIGRPNSAAIGSAVSTARSSGEDRTAVMSRLARKSAAAFAITRPASDRWKSGSRPYRTPRGLSTSPCRTRWTRVSWSGEPIWPLSLIAGTGYLVLPRWTLSAALLGCPHRYGPDLHVAVAIVGHGVGVGSRHRLGQVGYQEHLLLRDVRVRGQHRMAIE